MDAMLAQFAEHCPVAVMAQVGLQHALGAAWVDDLFAQHRGAQYTRTLLFPRSAT